MIDVRVADADEQIGVLREVVDHHQLVDKEEPIGPPSSSSSLGSDDLMELDLSSDHPVWTTAELTAVPDSPSIQSKRKQWMDEFIEEGLRNRTACEKSEEVDDGVSNEELSEDESDEESCETESVEEDRSD